jgi:hypothetical protein
MKKKLDLFEKVIDFLNFNLKKPALDPTPNLARREEFFEGGYKDLANDVDLDSGNTVQSSSPKIPYSGSSII